MARIVYQRASRKQSRHMHQNPAISGTAKFGVSQSLGTFLYLYDQSTGPQGGRSELQKMTNQFKNKYWIKIPRERREQILNEQDKLSYEYYSRMKLFFQFNPR